MDEAFQKQMGNRETSTESTLGPYWLDRLVDGELSELEQQRIVSTLDHVPDGWKRCALGFLESQIWRRGLKDWKADASSSPPCVLPAVRPAVEKGRVPRMPWTGWLTLATSMAMAFWIGNSIQVRQGDLGNGGTSPQVPSMADVGGAPPSAMRSPADEPTQFVTNNFWEGRPAIPKDISQILQNYGARVQRRNGYLRAKTADGQWVMVPYEDVQLVPDGDRSY